LQGDVKIESGAAPSRNVNNRRSISELFGYFTDWRLHRGFDLVYRRIKADIDVMLSGDGAAPQNGACHTGYPSSASTWLDIWVDGRDGSSSSADSCMGNLTGVRAVIVNAGPGRPVTAGPIASGGGCAL
jgi:hypothetical protein